MLNSLEGTEKEVNTKAYNKSGDLFVLMWVRTRFRDLGSSR